MWNTITSKVIFSIDFCFGIYWLLLCGSNVTFIWEFSRYLIVYFCLVFFADIKLEDQKFKFCRSWMKYCLRFRSYSIEYNFFKIFQKLIFKKNAFVEFLQVWSLSLSLSFLLADVTTHTQIAPIQKHLINLLLFAILLILNYI